MTTFDTMSPKTDSTMDITTNNNNNNNNTFGMPKPTNENEPTRLQLIDDLKLFLATAAEKWDNNNEPLKKFQLPTGEAISCVLWNNLYFITGTDIVRSLTFRFNAFGRPINNAKKFEEGIFSDLRNLKPGIDARLEEPKSDLLDMLYKNNCIRTQKKQKVFYWYSVPHDRLFLDALERDLKREKMGCEPTTTAVAEPALSTTLDTTQELFDQLRKNMSITAAANAHALEEEVKATRISLDGQLSPKSPTSSTGSRRSTSSMNSNNNNNNNNTLIHSTLAERAQKSRSRVNSVPTEFGQDHQQQLQQLLVQQRQQQRQQYRLSHNSYFSSLSSMKSRQRIPSTQDDNRSVSSTSQDSLVDGVHQLDIATSNSNGHGHFQRHASGHTCSRHQQKHQQHLQRQQQQQALSKNNVLPSKSLDSNTLKKTKSIFGNLPLFDGSPTYKQRRRRAASVNTAAAQQQQQQQQGGSSVSSIGSGGGPDRVRRHTNNNNSHSRTPSITSPTSPTSPISPVRSSFGITPNNKLNTNTNNNNNMMMNKQMNVNPNSTTINPMMNNNNNNNNNHTNNNNVDTMNAPSMQLSTSKLALAAMSAGHGNKYSSIQQHQHQLDQVPKLDYSAMFHPSTSPPMQLNQKHISPSSTTSSSVHSNLYMQPSSLSCSQQDHHLMMMHQWADMIDSAATTTHFSEIDQKDHLMSTNMYTPLPSSSTTSLSTPHHHHHHHQQQQHHHHHHHHLSSFMCNYCGKHFQSMDILDQHRKLHENGLQQDDFMIKDETDDDNEQYQYHHHSYQQQHSSTSSSLYQTNNGSSSNNQQQHSFSNQGTNSTPHHVFHQSSTVTSPSFQQSSDQSMFNDNNSHYSNEYIHSPSSASLSSQYQDTEMNQQNKPNYYYQQQHHEMIGMLSPVEDMDTDIKEVISPTLQQCNQQQQTFFGYASPEQSDHGLTPLPTTSTTIGSGGDVISSPTHLSPTSNNNNDYMLSYQQQGNNNTLLLEDELCSTSSTSSPSSILHYNNNNNNQSSHHHYYDLIQPVLLSPFKPEPYQQQHPTTLNQNVTQQDMKDLMLDSYINHHSPSSYNATATTPNFYNNYSDYTPLTTTNIN